MAKEDIFLGKGGMMLGPCNHIGFIVPMAMIPAMVDAKMPDGSIQKTNAMLTKTAQCIKCSNVWTFDHQIAKPQASPANGDAPQGKVPEPQAPEEGTPPPIATQN